MQIEVDITGVGKDLEHLIEQMLPVDLSNVVALRPSDEPVRLSPEEAFIAWSMGLPETVDIATAAASALLQLDELKKYYPDPAVEQLEHYLRDAVLAVPPTGRCRGRRGRRQR